MGVPFSACRLCSEAHQVRPVKACRDKMLQVEDLVHRDAQIEEQETSWWQSRRMSKGEQTEHASRIVLPWPAMQSGAGVETEPRKCL